MILLLWILGMINAETNDSYTLDEADIFVFRTNITSKSAYNQLCEEFEKLEGLKEYSIDLEDCDKVLRMVCENIAVESIIEMVERKGFLCEELDC